MSKKEERAGVTYAADQIEGDHFMSWVRDQMYEASQMDPSQVLPLETKADAKVIARNMLQQLEWDVKRDLNESPDFFKGFSEYLDRTDVIDWLADEVLSINEELRSGGTEEAKRKRHPEMTGGVVEFAELLKSLVDTQGRSLFVRTEHRLGGPANYFKSAYVNFVNLPEEIVARKAGGGAEAQNNRMSFWVEGFNGSDPHAPPPTGKVKVEMRTSALPREYWLRAKTGKPGAIAHYLADFLNKVVREVPPKYTHTRVDETARRPSGKPFAGIDANERAFHGVHNALVGIFLDGVKGVSPDLGHYQPTPEQADATLERARRLLADFESQTRIPRGRAQRWMQNKIDELRRHIEKAEAVRSGESAQQMTPEDYENLRKHLHRPGTHEAPRSKAPPKRFKSAGGRTFTLGSMERTLPRFEGDRKWSEMWPILYKSEPAGKLFRSDTYRAPLEWSATTRELVWKYASDAPTGIGFDVAAFATPQEALDAWGRSADQILDWSEGKPVHTIYKGSPHQKKSGRRRSRKR